MSDTDREKAGASSWDMVYETEEVDPANLASEAKLSAEDDLGCGSASTLWTGGVDCGLAAGDASGGVPKRLRIDLAAGSCAWYL